MKYYVENQILNFYYSTFEKVKSFKLVKKQKILLCFKEKKQKLLSGCSPYRMFQKVQCFTLSK